MMMQTSVFVCVTAIVVAVAVCGVRLFRGLVSLAGTTTAISYLSSWLQQKSSLAAQLDWRRFLWFSIINKLTLPKTKYGRTFLCTLLLVFLMLLAVRWFDVLLGEAVPKGGRFRR